MNFGPIVNITFHFGNKLDIRNETGILSNEKVQIKNMDDRITVVSPTGCNTE